MQYPDQDRLRLTPRQVSVRRYFTPRPQFPVRGLIGPGIAALIGLILMATGAAIGVVIGLVLIAVGAAKAVPRINRYIRGCGLAEPKPTDHQMDMWLAEAIDPICQDGFRRLDIVPDDLVDKDAPPLVVVGFPKHLPDFLEPQPGDSDGRRMRFRLARGKDGKIRATHYDILVVYLTSWHLCTYQCVLEMETGDVISDRTREFHYRDVVSVATESERLKIQVPVDHSGHGAAAGNGAATGAAAGNGAAGNGAKAAASTTTFEFTSSQWFRLRVSSDQIAVLVALFDIKAYGEGTDIDIALRQIRGRLREYTRLHEEGSGAFDDLHMARRRGEQV